MAVESQGCRAAAYCRRHPEQTSRYQVVQQHLETYLALAGEDDWDAQRVPAYVEREWRRSLISKRAHAASLAFSFARASCPQMFRQGAGTTSWLPSRARVAGCARRATPGPTRKTAAHLVDHVFPPLPVRQWGEE